MKKAMMTEIIAIILFIILLSIFILSNKMKTAEVQATRSKSNVLDQMSTYQAVTSNNLPLVTKHQIPLDEWLGAYMCYGQRTMDYELNGNLRLDIIDTTREYYDTIYGKGKWALLLNYKQYSILPRMPFLIDPSESMKEDRFAIAQIRDTVSTFSDIISFTDLPPEALDCDHDSSIGGTKSSEHWAGAVKYVCENGPPDGWEGIKAVFFSSDEPTCSLDPHCSNAPPNTLAWIRSVVNEAISECRSHGVKVFFMRPPVICGNFWYTPNWVAEADRLASRTGGITVDLASAGVAANQIATNLNVRQTNRFVGQITSESIYSEVSLPDVDIISFTTASPCPCRFNSICEITYLYSPQGGFE